MFGKREVEIQLADGKLYRFSERRKSESDTSYMHSYVKKNKMLLAGVIPDQSDRLAMYIYVMNQQLQQPEVVDFFTKNIDAQYDVLYNSFKLKNPDVTLEEFKALAPEGMIQELLNLVFALETDAKQASQTDEKKKASRFLRRLRRLFYWRHTRVLHSK